MVTKNRFKRLYQHWSFSNRRAQQMFPPTLLKRVEQLIAQSENQHLGQLRFVIEASLPTMHIWNQLSARERAWHYFSQLGVWDTEHNSGVLLYIGCADHALEIVADRGISRQISDENWHQICQQLGQDLAQQRFEVGLEQALERMTALLVAHLPRDADTVNDNELSDEVVWR